MPKVLTRGLRWYTLLFWFFIATGGYVTMRSIAIRDGYEPYAVVFKGPCELISLDYESMEVNCQGPQFKTDGIAAARLLIQKKTPAVTCESRVGKWYHGQTWVCEARESS